MPFTVTDEFRFSLYRDVFAQVAPRLGVAALLDETKRNEAADSSKAIVDRWLNPPDTDPPPDEDDDMALPDYEKFGRGTALVLKSSGGDAVLTLASLAASNGTSTGGRQAGTLDLTALWAQWWRIETEFEKAATPTDKVTDLIYGSFHSATGAGFGNTSGSDGSYTGYSNNNQAACDNHLRLIGKHINTVQATSTVQKSNNSGIFVPSGRYMNIVLMAYAAFHSSDANCLIRFIPLERSIQDTV